jgi:hypothetical protein
MSLARMTDFGLTQRSARWQFGGCYAMDHAAGIAARVVLGDAAAR